MHPSVFIAAAKTNYPGSFVETMRNRFVFFFRFLLAYRSYSLFCRKIECLASTRCDPSSPRLIGLVEWPYINACWDVQKRYDVVAQHYQILSHSGCLLNFIGEEDEVNLIFFDEIAPGVRITIDRAPWFVREGELVLNVFEFDLRIASLSFSFAYGQNNSRAAFIGAVQGIHSGIGSEKSLQIIKRLTKSFHGVRPRSMLIFVLQCICKNLNVDAIHAICGSSRQHTHSYYGGLKLEKFKTDYDQIWSEHGGVFDASSGFFVLPITPEFKEMGGIPSNKRAMYRRRFEMLDAIACKLPSTLCQSSQKPS